LARHKAPRLSRSALIALLREQPLAWRALKEQFGDAARLGKLLRGLEQGGEIARDAAGRYYVAASADRIEGVVGEQDGGLALAGHPLERVRGSRIRPGDRVAATLVDGRVRVLEVLGYSPEPVIGILRLRARHPAVEALGAHFRGRVGLMEAPQANDGDTVQVKILGEDRYGLTGIVQQVVALESTAGQAAESMLAAYHVPVEWPQETVAATDALPRQVQGGRHRHREDLRELPLVTIDGETARDFDDAVYAEPDGKGFRLTVAIADVGHYVHVGDALDTEAWRRGTSVYLPDRVVPMLPEALSNHLCSLRPNEDRLALVCEMRVDARGEVGDFRFFEAVIRSWHRLTYTQVAGYLAGDALEAQPPVLASLDCLARLYAAFASARTRRGGLEFTTHEGALQLSAGRVVAITLVERNDAHRLIEEAMIAANVCAARFLEARERPGLYRVHESPKADRLEALEQAFAIAGVTFRAQDLSPVAIHRALEAVGESPNRWIVEMGVLRSMTQAYYSPENRGHFGLALERYMHFTSPIRRYPDLIVHRAIKRALAERRGDVAPMEWLIACGAQASMTERRAEEVDRAVEAWLKCDFLADRVGEVFDGVIAGVTDFGLFVELEGYFVQGLVHVSALGNDYFHYRPEAMALVGESSGRGYQVGDALRVKLVGAEPELGKLDLEPLRTGGTSRPKDQGARAGKRPRASRGAKRGTR
jgi:ribonuclease R